MVPHSDIDLWPFTFVATGHSGAMLNMLTQNKSNGVIPKPRKVGCIDSP